MKSLYRTIFFWSAALLFFAGCSNPAFKETSVSTCQPMPEDAKPWVFWYWNNAAVSREGITTDLEAMKEAGIGGAYLFFIRGASEPPLFDPPAVQLSPGWWELVRFTFSEAKRLGLKLGLHSCDGFTVAGGPWITPELSMQKVVWSDTIVNGGVNFSGKLKQPETIQNYYRDLKVFAYPLPSGAGLSSYSLKPRITTSIPSIDPSFLNIPGSPERFRSNSPCWIQFEFQEPFPLRTIVVKKAGNIYQAERLILETSNDGQHFSFYTRLSPHRQGWMDAEADVTFSIKPVTAKFFRFIYDPEGTEPGAEDLDAAKWGSSLKIAGIELSSSLKINQYEGKNGSVWRQASRASSGQLPDSLCIPAKKLADISSLMNEGGQLDWQVPQGKWVILRMGYTTTGKTNYIGGGGKGLECDKFNPGAAEFQFDHWLGEFYRQAGDSLVRNVLSMFHADSWECGSQNWSPVFAGEFSRRRGYSLMPFLPVFAGIPLRSPGFSEKVLLDVRATISELVADNFYGTFARLSGEKGLYFSAESSAPVMSGDGMLPMKYADFPMGEFWFNSPTHDKPNDILDAVSAGHIYGKKIIQAEGFTEIRIGWNEHPGMLKTLCDRNLASGINRIFFHVFCHNPWPERKPGMTLGVVGLFFQPSQTWFKPGKVWVDYIRNCQSWLQQGVPVADVAVFTGEEIPRRAALPGRLMPVLPGILGEKAVLREKERIENNGQPMAERPRGVKASANIYDPADWIDPLRGYSYDSFNKDALLRLAKVRNGRAVFPGGASYALLVIPSLRNEVSGNFLMSQEVAGKLAELAREGATVLFEEIPEITACSFPDSKKEFSPDVVKFFSGGFEVHEGGLFRMKKFGKGRVIAGPFGASSFSSLGIDRDFYALDENRGQAEKIAWAHRSDENREIYFLSNQENRQRGLELSFRVMGKIPELYFPVSATTSECRKWHVENGRTFIPFRFEGNESVFVIFKEKTSESSSDQGKNRTDFESVETLEGGWDVEFSPDSGGPEEPVRFGSLTDWSQNPDEKIRFYSGTAVYRKTFEWQAGNTAWIDLGRVGNLAEVTVNGINCGVAWTSPFRLDISDAVKEGTNQLEIAVTNTWANRLIGDHSLPEPERITFTTMPYRLEGQPLLPAGLAGPVKILKEK